MKAVKITKPLCECRTQGDFMRYARESKGLSRAHLAELAGVTEESIRRWEVDLSRPCIDFAIFVCDVLGCSLDEYVGRKVKNETRD